MLAALLLLGIITAIGLPVTGAWPEPVVPREFVLASNHFGFQLLNRRSQEMELLAKRQEPDGGRENIFFSPVSISTVMAMLHQGAAGETCRQLETILGYRLAGIDGDKSLVGRRARAALELLSNIGTSNRITLKMANAFLINNRFRIHERYNETIREYFDSEMIPADFGRENEYVMAAINQWCSYKTDGKIKNFLQQPPLRTTQLALINAVYFKGNWKNRFPANQTAAGTFYSTDGQLLEDVPFMRRQGRIVSAYLSELESDLVEMPYEGDDVSMFAVLPRSNESSLTYVRRALNPWYVEAAISRLNEESDATIIFPKLNIESRWNLKETLKDIGLVDVFDFGRADLSAISNETITVDEVRHHAVMEINEDGTEAAASTYVGFVKMSLQPSSVYHFNRPFVFFIRHNTSGQILFVGEVNKP